MKVTKNVKDNYTLTEEKLNELKKQTKDELALLFIRQLRRMLVSKRMEDPKTLAYRNIAYKRIMDAIEKERRRNNLSQYKNQGLLNANFYLKISSYKRKSLKVNLPGSSTLEKLSVLIQREFDLDPAHAYEFKIGNLNFGPECDDWKEIFDFLDNYTLSASLGSAGLSEGDYFKFIYDFGENIGFKITILDIKNGK